MKNILIIQTAFIGDVVLATVLVEKLAFLYPDANVDFLLREGNETLLTDHPKLRNVLVWNKRRSKYFNLLKIILEVRRNKYDAIINVHRFASSGFIALFSGAPTRIGFDKNPLSFAFTKKVGHSVENGQHEVERNLSLIESFGGDTNFKPKLYFSEVDKQKIEDLVTEPYVVIAPSSVWYTKQFPSEKWIELIQKIPNQYTVCMIGAGNDVKHCEKIIASCQRENMINLSGKLSFLESCALMKNAAMNFVNDSAPMHFASAVNAKTTAIFCSTIPEFGFGPLSDDAKILQFQGDLDCRPCGLHGWKACPEGHFKCAYDIQIPESIV